MVNNFDVFPFLSEGRKHVFDYFYIITSLDFTPAFLSYKKIVGTLLFLVMYVQQPLLC